MCGVCLSRFASVRDSIAGDGFVAFAQARISVEVKYGQVSAKESSSQSISGMPISNIIFTKY